MKTYILRKLAILLVFSVLLLQCIACNNNSAPNELTKIVLVVDKYSYNAEYDEMLDMFNTKLRNLGKDYYLEIKVVDNLPSEEELKLEESEGLKNTAYSMKYQNSITDMYESNEQVDLIAMANIDDSSGYSDYDAFYKGGYLYALDDMLKGDNEYNFFNRICEITWKASKRDGKTYIVPVNKVATTRGWCVPTREIKELGIEAHDFNAELWSILEDVRLRDKSIYAELNALGFTSGSNTPLPPYNLHYYYDMLTSCVGVKFDGETPVAISIFEDEFMLKYIETSYAITEESEYDLHLYPCVLTNTKIYTDADNTYIPIGDSTFVNSDVIGIGIASWSENKEKAFDLICELNTNKELATLINYGIEGEHYSLNSDGSVSVSDIQFEKYRNPYYLFSCRSVLPEDKFLDSQNYDLSNASLSPICGFVFDPTNVKDEIVATNQVIENYRDILFIGKGNYSELIGAFISELKSAGIDKIIDEANSQITLWQNANN